MTLSAPTELARIFVGMFEGTGLVPLIRVPKEAKAAKELWDAPGFEARVALCLWRLLLQHGR